MPSSSVLIHPNQKVQVQQQCSANEWDHARVLVHAIVHALMSFTHIIFRAYSPIKYARGIFNRDVVLTEKSGHSYFDDSTFNQSD